MAEVFDALGDGDRAAELRAKAAALFERFNAAFWDDELGFYAYALDGDKKKVLTVASNAGHCLWSGIVPRERAKIVVERLMAPDMWSGWGIRTLSTNNGIIRLDRCGRTTSVALRVVAELILAEKAIAHR
jgi:glycogen debranching enzyme